MTTIHEGDLVLLTDGESIIQGRARRDNYTGELVVGTTGSISSAYHYGYDVTLVERATPEEAPRVLPTEDGVYADSDGDLWHVEDGRWTLLGSEHEGCDHDPAEFFPFWRLVPESDCCAREAAVELPRFERVAYGDGYSYGVRDNVRQLVAPFGGDPVSPLNAAEKLSSGEHEAECYSWSDAALPAYADAHRI